MRKLFFPALIIFSLLIVDGFLMNDLQLENEVKKFPAFKTETLSGEEVTQEIFSEKITILCIWTTNQENFEVLAELERMQKNLPADVQIIGVIGNYQIDEAKKISEKFSPSILQLKVNDNFFPVLEKVRTVPTTIFIDKQKNLVGQPAGGADAKFIRRELDYILKKKSPQFLAAEKIHENILYR